MIVEDTRFRIFIVIKPQIKAVTHSLWINSSEEILERICYYMNRARPLTIVLPMFVLFVSHPDLFKIFANDISTKSLSRLHFL